MTHFCTTDSGLKSLKALSTQTETLIANESEKMRARSLISVLHSHVKLTLRKRSYNQQQLRVSLLFNETSGWQSVVLHTTPSMLDKLTIHTPRSVEVSMKNTYRFIEGQTHFGMPRVANNEFGLSMNQNRLLFIHIQKLPLSMHHKCKQFVNFV